ncbi:MAG: HEPN domain-containing protein [Treponema sp.]|jgi:HEPN domain-containing protein|nr:HEPN domain-containing protein [Treponema sp.]
MNLNDTIQWLNKADDDYDAAKILNGAHKKHNEIICYLCSQAAEKYFKGYLIHKNHKIENTHNLPFLNNLCIKYDNRFEGIKTECSTLNKFNSNIRYPDGVDADESDVSLSLKTIEKILNSGPLLDLREEIKAQQVDKTNGY